MAIFSLQPSNVGGTSGYCIIAGLDSYTKMLTNFLFPSLFIPVMLIIAVINTYTDWKLSDLLCNICCCQTCFRWTYIQRNGCKCSTKTNQFFQRKAFMFKSFIRILLMYVGVAITTLFQLITVVQLGNGQYVYYYAPYKEFNIAIFIVCLLCILLIFGVFINFWRILHKFTE
eukprot:384678_1